MIRIALDERCQPEVKRAVEVTRAEMLANPAPIAPRLMAFPPWTGIDDRPFSLAVDPGLMADWRSKNSIGALIVKILFQAKARATVFLSDGFGAMTPPEGKTFDDMPSYFGDWPRELIREALLVFVNALGMKGYSLVYQYSRDGKGRRVFSADPPIELDHGRFCYDLTDATELSATLDALHRDRDGELEANA
jgi:hypothetical protein